MQRLYYEYQFFSCWKYRNEFNENLYILGGTRRWLKKITFFFILKIQFFLFIEKIRFHRQMNWLLINCYRVFTYFEIFSQYSSRTIIMEIFTYSNRSFLIDCWTLFEIEEFQKSVETIRLFLSNVVTHFSKIFIKKEYSIYLVFLTEYLFKISLELP